MSWNNPTPEEAQDNYDAAVSRYNNAAEDYCSARSAYYDAQDEWKSSKQSLENAINDERRLKALETRVVDALKILRENGAADERIEAANSAEKEMLEALSGCVRCTGINCPAVSNILTTESVSHNDHSKNAYNYLKAERDQLEEAIIAAVRLEHQIEASIQDLERKMTNAANVMSDANRTMNATTLDMEHYGKYIEQ